MPDRPRKARLIGPEVDLAAIPDDEAKAIIEKYSHLDPQSGTLQVFGNRFLLLRPETLVAIQKQLEETVGASTKGIIYLAGERSFMEGHVLVKELLEGFDLSSLGPEVLKRMADILALLGWGRFTYGRWISRPCASSWPWSTVPSPRATGPRRSPRATSSRAGWPARPAASWAGSSCARRPPAGPGTPAVRVPAQAHARCLRQGVFGAQARAKAFTPSAFPA
ncbi:MAG: hypothetical protein AABX97_04850 [Candidatus Thermoplasmatota archaeon]